MNKSILLVIVLLAAILRFNQLNTLPALNADEAAIGYNAYALLLTGKDEHGNSWPVHFQSFNDYKPGLYFYLVLSFVKLLGLTELAVRLPGAALGVATVFIVWLLVRQLFPDKRWLPELSALFLAISPWHLHFSRGGWEVNAATFFIVLGVFAFVRALGGSRWWYVASASFVAALYTYHAARIIVPLLVLGLAIINKPAKILKARHAVLAVVVGVFLLLPLARDLLGPAGISRAAGVGLFTDTGPFWRTNQQRGEHADFTGLPTVVLHNKVTNYSLAFLENYFEHFWGEFLFLSGDEIQRNKVPEMGQMYLFDLIFLIAGLLAVARKPSGWGPILVWLLVAPTAAALTFQSPHALRSQNMVAPLVIISAYGIYSLVYFLKKQAKSKTLFITYCLLLIAFLAWDFSRHLHQYYSHMAKTYDFSSQYGVKELVEYAVETQKPGQQVVVTDRYDQPYILFLFHLKYPPDKFQQEHALAPRDKFGFSTVREFGIYTFREVGPWDEIRREYPDALVAGAADEVPDGANILKTIYFPSDRAAFKVVAD